MILKNDFDEFLSEIRPTASERSALQEGHSKLRSQLVEDEYLKKAVVSHFLQGSYRRSTAIRARGQDLLDVDIIVVTSLSSIEYTPDQAMQKFVKFLDTHYAGQWRIQGRSFGITLPNIKMDLVITSAPSEETIGVLKSAAVQSTDELDIARDWRLNESWISMKDRTGSAASMLLQKANAQAEWKTEPLLIPDRRVKEWKPTNPLEQLRWTRDKNQKCGGHFVNVVKAIKWWRISKHERPEHPKSFPLERIIGEHCISGIESVAEGVSKTLDAIASAGNVKPHLSDYGVPSHDVLKQITDSDYRDFHKQVVAAAAIAQKAFASADRQESRRLWHDLFGPPFPKPDDDRGGFTIPKGPAKPDVERFA